MSHNNTAPVLMVRTISSFCMEKVMPTTAESVKLALGACAATIISPSGPRQFSTATELQRALSLQGGDHRFDIDIGMCDVMDEEQFNIDGTEPIKAMLTQAAIRGTWSPNSDSGLIMVTSVYPIQAALNAQRATMGVRYPLDIEDIAPGKVVAIDPDMIGFALPEIRSSVDENTDLQQPSSKPKWLDIFRRKPHNEN